MIQEKNLLTAGGPKTPATLVIEPAPALLGQSAVTPRDRPNQATVLGPGKFEMYDAAAKATTTTATWQKSMVHTKERINDRDIDLFTLTDAARFEDKRADYWLKGAILKLWLAPSKDAPSAGKVEMTTSRSLPHRIQAIGEVSGHSADMDVEQTDQLIAYFADVAPPEPVTGPAAPVVPMAPGTIPPRDLSAPPPMPMNEPAKPRKPPMKLRARTIETWVDRYPLPKNPGAHRATCWPGRRE